MWAMLSKIIRDFHNHDRSLAKMRRKPAVPETVCNRFVRARDIINCRPGPAPLRQIFVCRSQREIASESACAK